MSLVLPKIHYKFENCNEDQIIAARSFRNSLETSDNLHEITPPLLTIFLRFSAVTGIPFAMSSDCISTNFTRHSSMYLSMYLGLFLQLNSPGFTFTGRDMKTLSPFSVIEASIGANPFLAIFESRQ